MATTSRVSNCIGRVARIAVGGAALLAIPLAEAQTETLSEVVVSAPRYVPDTNISATKIAIPLIETPQSISVITRDQIDVLDFQNLQQAVRYISGVIGENFGPDERYDWLTLRGFNPVEYIDGLQAPIGSVPKSDSICGWRTRSRSSRVPRACSMARPRPEAWSTSPAAARSRICTTRRSCSTEAFPTSRPPVTSRQTSAATEHSSSGSRGCRGIAARRQPASRPPAG